MVDKIKPGFEFKKTAVWSGEYYHHFGIHPTVVNLYGDKVEDIETIDIKISEDQSALKDPMTDGKKNIDYWGWFDNDDQEFSDMIFASRFLLEMCFPGGIKNTEETGRGKAYRLEITTNK